MSTVTLKTAKRLAEAGFPQPTPERGQIWLSEVGAEYLIQAVGQDGSVDYSCGTAYTFISRRLEADGCVFAPTATDIMRELPGWSICFATVIGWHVVWDYGLCDPILFKHEKPAEAAAQAWLHENKKK